MDFYIRPKRRPQGQKVTRKLNITKLKNQLTAQDLQSRMDSKLLDIRSDQSSIDEQWESFRDTVHSIALETLGQVTRNHQDWFDENDQEIQKLLEEKRRLLRAHQNDTTCTAKKAAFNNIRSTVQAKLRLMQDAWLSAKADEIQGYADKHDTKKFYEALKAVYGPQFSFGSTPLLSSDGTSFPTNKRLILERWAEHFNIVLNRPAQINEEAIARLPQVPTNHELAVPPAVEENFTGIFRNNSAAFTDWKELRNSDSEAANTTQRGSLSGVGVPAGSQEAVLDTGQDPEAPVFRPRSSEVQGCRRIPIKKKLQEFDGKVSWEAYRIRFELLADQVLKQLSVADRSRYSSLVEVLWKRYGNMYQSEVYIARFRTRVRARGESLQ
ncbi:Hypothetical predicted protein [Octopus vulgaris]|uniref:Uncharacterized protein n=2 Tax=Octopus vulgaris TaxID=6645 RepID=A0AA36BJ13_OCTVU|nr:Hypothetical predicted protein [Octopus vulgaris]